MSAGAKLPRVRLMLLRLALKATMAVAKVMAVLVLWLVMKVLDSTR